MTKETYRELRILILNYGDARFFKGVAPLGSDAEKKWNEVSDEIFKKICEILFKEID